MALKPQDVLVALKVVANGSRRAPYAELADELGMSASEVHASVQRAVQSHLLHGPEMQHRPNLAALEEFLVHGLRYAFPAEHGEFTRGVATSYAAEPLRKLIPRGNDPIPVWPSVDGKERGMAFSPLYRTAPVAALRDPAFYEYLVLADALRDGRARERKIAEGELHKRLEASMLDSNREQLINAAQLLRPLLDEVVFVGGAVTGLLITDSGAGDPRATRDVDAIAAITSYPAYVTFGERLRALGFAEDTSDGAPLCRWVNRTTVLDVMPLDEEILGFSNRWYAAAMAAAVRHQLTDNLVVRVVTAPYFIATKLEAFKGRGNGDFFSHDLEDLINVVDGRETITTEVHAENAELREYLRTEISRLLATPQFLDALHGHLRPDPASQARVRVVLQRLREFTRI